MIPFAGWDMPVWYTSVLEEHTATRTAAGLFDVTHMGVFQAEGPDAGLFLDSVTGNDIVHLEVGESYYTHFMDPHANVLDDLLVYRRDKEKWLVVVNAANEDKDWAWLEAVRQGKVLIDIERPWSVVPGRHDPAQLKDRKAGATCWWILPYRTVPRHQPAGQTADAQDHAPEPRRALWHAGMWM